MAVIEAIELCKSYGGGRIRALRGVSFSIERGEVIGLLGPNGAGKTTLMKLLTGYLQPDDGSARIAGHDIVDQCQQAQRHIGYLPENAPLYHEMAVQEYLQLMAGLRAIAPSEQRARLSEAIYATGLESYLTRRIGTLSKGYKQRVGIAQAILHRPEVLILDEPTTGLDPTQIVEIRELIQRLSRHSTVLLSTHILSEVEATCERALVVIDGELRADAPIADLNQGHSVVLALHGMAADVEKRLRSIDGVADVSLISNTQEDEQQRWRIEGERNDLSSLVFDYLKTTDWRVAELRQERRSLEAVFHELATRVEAPHEEEAA